MRQLKQILIYDYGNCDLDICWTTGRNPLAGEKYPPTLFMTFKHANSDYFVAYWHKQNHERLSVSQIRDLALYGYAK